jgi:surfactin synthase thioesterase subunit
VVDGTQTSPNARLSVLWFPHACGLADAYRCFEVFLPREWKHVGIEYPGHGRRSGRPCRSMSQLADSILGEVISFVRQPYAFFGHSMGALVAFRMALEVSRAGLPLPSFLGVSGRGAPGRELDSSAPLPPARSEANLMALLQTSSGTPPEALEDERARRRLLDVASADLELCDSYRTNASLSQVPIIAYYASADPHTEPRSLVEWASRTNGSFCLRRFEGGHFYLFGDRSSFASALRRDAQHLGSAIDS